MKRIFLLGWALFIGFAVYSQEFPDIRGWLDAEHYLEMKKDKKEESHLYKVNALSGKSSMYMEDDYVVQVNKNLPGDFMVNYYTVSTKDYKSNIFQKNNNLYYFNLPAKEFRQITSNPSEEKTPEFSPDEKKVAFTRDHNLYVVDLATGLESKLTTDGSDLIYNGWASWVYYEEILGRESRYRAFWWSPDSKYIAFLRFDDNPVPTFPIFNPDGVHGELDMTRYPKVGDPNPGVRLGIVNVENGEIRWIDNNDNEDKYIAWIFWAPDSKHLLYQVLNRDQNDLKIMKAGIEGEENKLVYEEKQDSWVDFFSDLYMLKDGSGFILRSDKSMWRNLYLYDLDGNLRSRLTDVNWRVKEILQVDEAGKLVYFTGTGGNPIETYLYKVNFDGSGLAKLTTEAGTHDCDIAPGGNYFIDTWSAFTSPAVMQLCDASGKIIKVLGRKEGPAEDVRTGKFEYFTISTPDGFDLPAYWILPVDFNPEKKYGVVFSIYGGPDYEGVTNHWINPKGGYMTQNGIIMFNIDHRGSGAFGKKGLNYMYRSLGKWETEDYITAVKWLKGHDFVDSTKIGITGGSYGGYMTCMALTLGSGYFTHGVASSAVTDWRLYDDIYTERYMDTPADNPEGYDFGSVMTHVADYKGKLYIMHGTMDDNVHMQNALQLIDKLEDLNMDFELMIYPKGRHGWGPPKYYHSYRESKEFWLKNFSVESISD